MSIEIRNVSKVFGNFQALNRIQLTVQTGELVALLGPSGSGKTTLLRIIAGLETPEEGEIKFFGEDAHDKKPKDRQVGFVFQHYALFKHMTVFDNIAFGLQVKVKHLRPPPDQIRQKVRDLLKLVQLEWVENRFPWQLSGGQRQRIALVRALAVEPKVLLLDEPFGSLDAQVRKELRAWLRRFHDTLHITSLFVTHDQEEALEVADRVVVMNEGKIEQIGTPEEVYHNPANTFVLNFLGNVNLFHCRAEDGAGGQGKVSKMYVRPHQVTITRAPISVNSVKAVIRFVNPAGSFVKIDTRSSDGHVFQVEISQDEYKTLKLVKNDEVYLTPKTITFAEYEI